MTTRNLAAVPANATVYAKDSLGGKGLYYVNDAGTWSMLTPAGKMIAYPQAALIVARGGYSPLRG